MHSLLEQTYLSLRNELKGFIYKRVNSNELAEDILHDVFLKAHANIDKLNDSVKLNGWIYQITRNAIIDYYRTKKPSMNLDGIDIEDEVNELSASKKLEPTVRKFLKNLPAIYREALIQTDYKGITQVELAKRLNISVSAVKSRVQRARKMLKDMFLECCHFEFDKFGTVVDFHPKCCTNCGCAA
jgi:RNA polymerase sigma-70 factor (ECF subfamily)